MFDIPLFVPTGWVDQAIGDSSTEQGGKKPVRVSSEMRPNCDGLQSRIDPHKKQPRTRWDEVRDGSSHKLIRILPDANHGFSRELDVRANRARLIHVNNIICEMDRFVPIWRFFHD